MSLTRTRRDILSAIAIGTIPVALLFIPGTHFNSDWFNSVWLASYFGEFFFQHLAFPVVVNTHQLIGLAYPVLYGPILYRVTGLLSIVIGGDLAMRIACITASVVQTFAILAACRRYEAPWFIAVTVSIAYSWQPYALTNLYNRSDLPEFIAGALLTTAAMTLLLIARASPGRFRPSLLLPGLLFSLAAGSHTLSAPFGGAVIALLGVVLILTSTTRVWLAGILLANAVLACVILSPLLYAILTVSARLLVAHTSPVLQYFAFDQFLDRFAPFPFDRRTLTLGSIPSTPYLEAQVSFPLVALAVLVISTRLHSLRRFNWWLIIPMIALSAFLMAASVSVYVASLIPMVSKLQFAYRIVGFADLAFLCGIVPLAGELRDTISNQTRVPLAAGVAACVAIATIGLALKLIHGATAESPGLLAGTGVVPEYGITRNDLLNLPSSFYGLFDYSEHYGKLRPLEASHHADFRVSDNDSFGEVTPLLIRSPAYIVTNALTFPWAHLRLNGRVIKPLYAMETNPNLYVYRVAPGKLAWELTPDPVWNLLNVLAAFVIGIFGLSLILERQLLGGIDKLLMLKGSR